MLNEFLLALVEVLTTTLLMLAAGVGAPLFIRWCCLIGSVLLEKWQARREKKFYLNALKSFNND